MGSSGAAGYLIGAVLFVAPTLGAAECVETSLDLRGPQGNAHFTVEIADTVEERAKGLMFRENLPRSAGMLFVYDRARPVQFWMKNTPIPLDMVFVDEQGVVTNVHANAVPMDETPIDGGDDVKLVLEINGGLAKRLGIAPGTVLRHPAIDPSVAIWPCGAE